ncbi:MAG: serine protein kinase RIO [Planctomycetes bacterium]|nr:serine protein kinase RIO [Planctomycetota bacterium]
MSYDLDFEAALQPLLDDAWITDVLGPVKSGKEATVYCCKAHPRTGAEYLAAKVYRPAERRSFHADAGYQEGRWTWRRPSRAQRAFVNKSEFGREVQFTAWLNHEWETLRALHAAGVSVPRPYASCGSSLLMEWLGEAETPAPLLQAVRLTPEEAGRALAAIVADVERMLAVNVVHGDLSAYNILWAGGRARIIDLPQATDPRFNPNAQSLLARDLENVHKHLARFGAVGDAPRRARDLWFRFREGQL